MNCCWLNRCVAVAAVMLGAFLLSGWQLHAQEKKAAAPKEQTKAVKPHDHDHDHDENADGPFLQFVAENSSIIQAVSAVVLMVALPWFFVKLIGKMQNNVGPAPPHRPETPQ